MAEVDAGTQIESPRSAEHGRRGARVLQGAHTNRNQCRAAIRINPISQQLRKLQAFGGLQQNACIEGSGGARVPARRIRCG